MHHLNAMIINLNFAKKYYIKKFFFYKLSPWLLFKILLFTVGDLETTINAEIIIYLGEKDSYLYVQKIKKYTTRGRSSLQTFIIYIINIV